MSIIVRDKDGNRKKIAGVGLPGPAGKSAYQYAVEGGFTGTEAEFSALVSGISNENLLDNWYFVDPINQRGQTEYTIGMPAIDRWIGACTLREDGIYIPGGIYYLQRIPFKSIQNYSDSITFSVLTTNGTLVSGDVSSGKFIQGDINLYLEYVSGTEYYSAVIWISEWFDDAVLQAAKLELGDTQTLAHQDASGNWVLNDPPPDKASELAKCQRYFFKSSAWNETKYSSSFYGEAYSSNVLHAIGNFPTTMRATPVVKLNGYQALSDRTINMAAASDAQASASQDGMVAVVDYSANFVPGLYYSVDFEASAEL